MGRELRVEKLKVESSSAFHPLSYSGECFRDTLIDGVERGQSVGDTHECEGKVEVFSFECIPKDVLVEAIGFAYQPFHAIAVNGMAETLLGH